VCVCVIAGTHTHYDTRHIMCVCVCHDVCVRVSSQVHIVMELHGDKGDLVVLALKLLGRLADAATATAAAKILAPPVTTRFSLRLTRNRSRQAQLPGSSEWVWTPNPHPHPLLNISHDRTRVSCTERHVDCIVPTSAAHMIGMGLKAPPPPPTYTHIISTPPHTHIMSTPLSSTMYCLVHSLCGAL